MSVPIPPQFIYPVYTGIIALALVLLVPRQEIRRLFIYGVIFGGIINVIWIGINGTFGFGGHINFGPFGIGRLAFFPPMAWALWFIMFFWFLPERTLLRVIYIVSAVAYSMVFSNVLVNMGIFEWKVHRVIYPLFMYTVWFTSATLAYLRVRDWQG